MYFEGKGPVPETLIRFSTKLREAAIPHVFIGATALYAHGYRRTTNDVDVCMRREDPERFRHELVGRGYAATPGRTRRVVDLDTNVTIDVPVTGEIAGNREKQEDIRFPDPSEAVVVEELPQVSLARLIELKLVTWRLRDWADVIELIRMHDLDEGYAENLHPAARPAYAQCYDQKLEEDRYNPELGD